MTRKNPGTLSLRVKWNPTPKRGSTKLSQRKPILYSPWLIWLRYSEVLGWTKTRKTEANLATHMSLEPTPQNPWVAPLEDRESKARRRKGHRMEENIWEHGGCPATYRADIPVPSSSCIPWGWWRGAELGCECTWRSSVLSPTAGPSEIHW